MTYAVENVLLRQIVTEKSTIQASEAKKFTFEVPSWATKNHVKEAFLALFPEATVLKVNTSKIFGKSKRTAKGRSNPTDSKKAIVTLSEDSEHIEYFPEI